MHVYFFDSGSCQFIKRIWMCVRHFKRFIRRINSNKVSSVFVIFIHSFCSLQKQYGTVTINKSVNICNCKKTVFFEKFKN